MRYACLFVGFHTQVPDLGSLLLGGFQSAKLASRQVVKSRESLWEGSVMDAEVLCGHSGWGVSRNDQAIYHGLSGQIGRGYFHPALAINMAA
jgi:hypothetical protein